MAKTHGHAGARKNGKWIRFPTPTYVSWEGMNRRVTPVHSEHKYYVGVKVCDRWKSFENFLADMGERPEGKTLDRIDHNGDYCPENCRWATWSQQNTNRKCTNFLTLNGATKPLSHWAADLGLHPSAIRYRLQRGWSLERALSEKSVRTSQARLSD